jgi:hypothetical protein
MAMVVRSTKAKPNIFIIMVNYLYESSKTLKDDGNGSWQKLWRWIFYKKIILDFYLTYKIVY